jgi:mannonate dehydratase
VPVAEEYKVKMGCHPQDPGVPKGYRGIDAVLASPEGLKKFVSIKESPYHGLNFCQGTVSEQLEKPGEQIYDVIRYLGSRKKIFSVHFRNIEGGYLNFRESFIDNGSVDMLKAARVYKEVGYDGVLMPDHVPHVDGDENQMQGFAFAIGYIKALIAAVSAEA